MNWEQPWNQSPADIPPTESSLGLGDLKPEAMMIQMSQVSQDRNVHTHTHTRVHTLRRGQRSSLSFTPANRMDVGTAAVTPREQQETPSEPDPRYQTQLKTRSGVELRV